MTTDPAATDPAATDPAPEAGPALDGAPGLRGGRVVARDWGWQHATRAAPALRGLDLEIGPGERVLLLGSSGAGKSTLLAAIAGVLGGDEDGEQLGELTVDGASPSAARGVVGLVLQDPDSQVVLARIGDDVAFGCENLGVPREQIWPRVRSALDAVGLRLPLDHPTSSLSGGQKQRLALAGVLAMRPRVILLDEPTANLDPEGVREVRDAVAQAAASTGATLVVVEHRVAVWQQLVDRVVVLEPGGGVAADGDADAVLRQRGAELAESGVWVPGHPPAVPSRHPSPGSESGAPALPLLVASGLSVGRGRTVAASAIEATVETGGVLAITGPNGAGKSTTALTVAGLLPPLAGRLTAALALRGTAGPEPVRWRSAELLTRIGTVFQDPEHQFLRSTVRAELEVGPRALGLPAAEIDARVTTLLGRLRLDALAEANPFTLSGGEKRRLSVATALATRPRLLVLDEPTFGQDRRTWEELVALLAELRVGGGSIIMVTHDAELVAALADRELVLDPAGVAREVVAGGGAP